MTRRSPRSWNRQDSVLVLAAYFEHGMPRDMERQRIANVLGMPVDAVVRRFHAYQSLERGEGGPAREAKLWALYHEDRLACLLEADEITEERRRLPYHLKKRLQP
ncbi:MAG: hypothetical protein ACPHK8_04195 [Thermoplasmatota archaeon]